MLYKKTADDHIYMFTYSIWPTLYDNHPNRKNESYYQKFYRAKPYSRPENHRVNALEYEYEDEDYSKIFGYYFSINVSSPLYAMRDLGDKARWQKKSDNPSDHKDKSNWCVYHEDLVHINKHFFALKERISGTCSKKVT